MKINLCSVLWILKTHRIQTILKWNSKFGKFIKSLKTAELKVSSTIIKDYCK